ncbi:MAG TPA: hypothetical protein VLB49_12105 [Gemmatimonadales bacterium]|nr:hypothetical protein [Gemmatimonadales bacterium]
MRLVVRAVSLFALACAQDPPSAERSPTRIEAAADEEFRLAIGETAVVAGTDLRITFRAVVNDSRCPSAVQCVSAGNAEVALQVRQGSADTSFVLNTTRGPRTATQPGFLIELIALTPYPERPESPIPAAVYRADLTVSILPQLTGIPFRLARTAAPN